MEGITIAGPRRPKFPKVVGDRVEIEREFLCGLEQIQPSASVLLSYKPMVCASRPTQPVIRNLPCLLTSLYNSEHEKLDENQLLSLSKEIFSKGVIEIRQDEAGYLEESTKLQAQSHLWFEHRIGRITSSKFFQVSRASLNPPPRSLVKDIMERHRSPSCVPALQWGITNERTAQEEFVQLASKQHGNFSFTPAGLHVHPTYPHLGASPDGLILCDCCGEGVLEIKCPYKYRNADLSSVDDTKFYLQRCDDGSWKLSRNHAYYHQIQGQLAICEKGYCDCWTLCGMHTERIVLEPSYLSTIKPKLDAFFVKALLPLLLTGKSVNNKQADSSRPAPIDPTSSLAPTYCWCRGGEHGRMIACDNHSCKIEWFHFDCAKLKRKPQGTWFCSSECKRQHCQ